MMMRRGALLLTTLAFFVQKWDTKVAIKSKCAKMAFLLYFAEIREKRATA
jgi:hypothetical protein